VAAGKKEDLLDHDMLTNEIRFETKDEVLALFRKAPDFNEFKSRMTIDTMTDRAKETVLSIG
jgi:hypothetical protein